MEIRGKIIAILPFQSGQGKNGEWRKQDYVLETFDQFPRKICFNLWGTKIDENPVQIGEEVNLFFDVESREFNGRWYTDVKGWKIEKGSTSSSSAPTQGVPQMASQGSVPPPPPIAFESSENDDLPF